MTNIEKQLEDARQNLLDLTMFNNLLNFRSKNAKTMRITDEIPTEIYDLLVLQEKVMEFLPKKKNQESEPDENQDDEQSRNLKSDISEEDALKLWELPSPDHEMSSRHTDRFLQTSYDSENLQKRLFYTSQQAKSVLEEQGYTILYLALGFLEWTESPSSTKLRNAPLILVPVELERHKVGTTFKLKWTGEDVFTNISLQAKLLEHGIALPEFEMPDDKNSVDQYFQSVADSILKMPNWGVLNDIYLSFFSFTKFVMYKDLDPTAWPDGKTPANHPLIISLFDPEEQQFESGFSEDDVDKLLNIRDQYNVMDADPSQIAVIEDVKSGINLVVEGPPGTGKSQTITNIIAELLATGKSVLFVSEKMAALEVVKNRLDDVGLGDFCLELHSRKSNKKEVLKEIERTISIQYQQNKSLSDDFDNLESLKKELNGYAEALREPIGELGQSPFDLFCMKENSMQYFENIGKTLKHIDFQNTNEYNQADWTAAQLALTNIVEALPLVKPISVHPWNWCSLDTVLPSDESAIEEILDDCIKSIYDMENSINELIEICAVQRPTNINDLKDAISASKVIAISKPVDANVLSNNDWDNSNDSALLLIKKVESLQKQLFDIHSKYDVAPFEIKLDGKSNDIPYVGFSGGCGLDQNVLADSTSALQNLAVVLPLIKPINTQSHDSCISDIVVQSDENDGEKFIEVYNASIDNLEDSINKLIEICAIQRPANISDLRHIISASKVIATSKPVNRNVLLNSEWDEPNDSALSLIQKVETLQKEQPNIYLKFNEECFKKDIDSILEGYGQLSKKSFLHNILSVKHHNLKREVKLLYNIELPKNDVDIISDLNELSSHIKLKNEIEKSNETGAHLFGSYWAGENSDPKMLRSFAEWIVTFRQQLLKNMFNDHVFDIVSSGVSCESAESSIENISNAETHFIESYKNLTKYIEHNLKTYKDDSKNQFLYDVLYAQYNNLKCSITHTKGTQDTILNLNELLTCIQLVNEIEKSNETGAHLFGSYWVGKDSDSKMLQSFAEWIVTFRQQLSKNRFNDHVFDIVSNGTSQEKAEASIEEVLKTQKSFIENYEKLMNRLDTHHRIVFDTEMEFTKFKDLLSRIDLWKNELPKLQRWGQFAQRRKDCLNTIAAPIVSEIDSDNLDSEDIIPCFEGNFADSLLRYAFMDRPFLANFVGKLHENKIQNFTDIDNQLIVKNRHRLAYKLYQNRPRLSAVASRSSEAGILQGEFNRKRRHMPIRKLMVAAGGLIQKIKPCFMMSPLSIAQFLDPQNINFDVVVFDEASQVKPEDAFGALLRANQAVIIGDTRQLPPTSFFDSVVDSGGDDEDETASIEDIESILHLCKSSFQKNILRWHYRSKHESLIAVSNQEFYDSQLVFYPSATENLDHLGLKFIHLPNSIYVRGKNSGNRIEARAVAKEAIEHYKKYPNKSLGVGTFNVKQQQAVLEEIELKLRDEPEMEDFFKSTNHDHFFVKNLETIQGDERDVIFISIGFGFDKDGKLSKRFGALNREGGERRLNVLITRAREKCVVFSNFQANDLRLDENSPFGLKSLKVFLDFAQNRNLITLESGNEDSESSFENSVCDFLRGKGYDIQKQVGCAGYQIDLALVDSKYLGRYLLGIEFDGVKYHSSSVARDRDRLRQQILGNLGWKIYRVWSTDWYRNRAECQQNLLEAIEMTINEIENEPETVDIDVKSQNTPVQMLDDDVNQQENINELPISDQIDETIPDYELCSSITIDMFSELYEIPTWELAESVIQVVQVESPVHLKEVVRRIRTHKGLGRSGNKITNAINKAADFANSKGDITIEKDFLFISDGNIQARRRTGDPPAKIELICDEEIAEVVKFVLKQQFSTPLDELIVQTSRLLGFQATRKNVSNQIERVIHTLIKKDELQHLLNGMIDLK